MGRYRKTIRPHTKDEKIVINARLTLNQGQIANEIAKNHLNGNRSALVRLAISELGYALGLRSIKERNRLRKLEGLQRSEYFEKHLKYKGYDKLDSE